MEARSSRHKTRGYALQSGGGGKGGGKQCSAVQPPSAAQFVLTQAAQVLDALARKPGTLQQQPGTAAGRAQRR